MIEKFKRVLCVCSCNQLRSPTMAWVLSQIPWMYNTRSAGMDKFNTLIPVTKALLEWAEEIVCADKEHKDYIKYRLKDLKGLDPEITCLHIPDKYDYMDRELISLIRERYGQKGVLKT